jgi:hypothetical protein
VVDPTALRDVPERPQLLNQFAAQLLQVGIGNSERGFAGWDPISFCLPKPRPREERHVLRFIFGILDGFVPMTVGSAQPGQEIATSFLHAQAVVVVSSHEVRLVNNEGFCETIGEETELSRSDYALCVVERVLLVAPSGLRHGEDGVHHFLWTQDPDPGNASSHLAPEVVNHAVLSIQKVPAAVTTFEEFAKSILDHRLGELLVLANSGTGDDGVDEFGLQ